MGKGLLQKTVTVKPQALPAVGYAHQLSVLRSAQGCQPCIIAVGCLPLHSTSYTRLSFEAGLSTHSVQPLLQGGACSCSEINYWPAKCSGAAQHLG